MLGCAIIDRDLDDTRVLSRVGMLRFKSIIDTLLK